MRKTLAAVALAATLLLTAVPAADATGWWSRSKPAPAPQPTRTLSYTESWLLQSVLDNVALTDIELTPAGRQFLNSILRALMPKLCPIVANAAAPEFRDLVLQGCQGVAAAPDPYGALLDFLPLACAGGDVIFPDYRQLIRVACGLLF
jgi:hypothetical protein